LFQALDPSEVPCATRSLVAVADLEQTKQNIQQLLLQKVFDNGKRQKDGAVIPDMAIRNSRVLGFLKTDTWCDS
jgi:hypothetical protein